MKLTGNRIVLAGIVLVGALLAFFLLGRDDNSLRLQAQVSGTVNATRNGANGQYEASGTGLANGPFGSVSLSGGGSGQAQANCVLFDGSGELVTAVGTLQLRLAKPGRACFTEATLDQSAGGGELPVAATVEASGTDGSLLGRHGGLKARGTYNTDSGSFTVRFTGRLHR
jgi:hypothetical protein